MQFNVAGVIVDGSTPVTATPARTDLVVYQGVDTVIQVTLTGSNGTAVNMTGWSPTAQVLMIRDRVMPNQGTPSILTTYTSTLTTPLAGVFTFVVPGSFIKSLILKTYWYDVFTTSLATGYRDEVVPTSMFSVSQAIGG